MKYLFTQLMALIVVAPLLAAPAQAGTNETVKPTSPETVVGIQIAAYNRGDIEAFVATFAPDVKTTLIQTPCRYPGSKT